MTDQQEADIDVQLYVPRLLYLRLKRRDYLKATCLINILLNVPCLIIGFIFIDCVWNTRSYIKGGDDFWDDYKVKSIQDNELQSYCSFTGIFSILTSFFNIMNSIVIIYHAHYGGLRIRLAFAQWINLILPSLLLIYSIIAIVKIIDLIILFIIFVAFTGASEILAIIIFVIAGKLVRKELEYMLTYDLMVMHKEEYHIEYITKKRTYINVKEEQPFNVNLQTNDNKIYMNK